MNQLSSRLNDELQNRFGTTEITTVTIPGDRNIVLTVEFEAVECVSSLVRNLTLAAPKLQSADSDQLQNIAERLCSQVTYLLEDIGPLEIDPITGQVLVRSTAPTETGDANEYYEILLRAEGGRISLERFATSRSGTGRRRVALKMTHEVLLRLVGDLEDAVN